MGKFETIKAIVRSRSISSCSSSDESDYDDIKSTTSSDSDLSLIQTSTINSIKSSSKRQNSTSVHIIPPGTLIPDVNNNYWMLHQCLKISHDNERFIYLCSQVKRSLSMKDNQLSEQNIIKTKISSILYLPEKFKQSREAIIEKSRTENEQLDYVFYTAMNEETDQSNDQKLTISKNNKNISTMIDESNSNRIIHGIIEFLNDDENLMKKYSIEIIFPQEKRNSNLMINSSELFQQILNKEIDKLKEYQEKNLQISENIHQYLIKKKSVHNQYDIQEIINQTEQNSSIDSSSNKYLLKLELTPSSSIKFYTIDHEISFYSRYATHDKLKSYIKHHNLMYLAIPEYISHGIYKHHHFTYKFLIMEQYRENLRSLISSYDQSLPEHNALNLFLQMLYVIQFLHEINYVHQIIKPKYLMFVNKQPFFIFLTQFRTVKNINESIEIPKENQSIKQFNVQLKKKVKHSHRTQLALIHNKTSSNISSSINISNSLIKDEHFLIHSSIYYHPFSVYSSLDIHLNNKQTYRGDLEMLGYNLIVWSGGRLPWDRKHSSKFQQQTITNEKILAKSNVNEFVKKCFFMKLISPVTLRAICDYMSTIYQLNIDDMPNFDQLRAPIKEIVKALGFKANACLRLSNSKSKTVNVSNNHSMNNTTIVKTNENLTKTSNVCDISSPTKELQIEREDSEDDENQSCTSESSSCENDDESSDDEDNDTEMEQQTPLISGQTSNTKCKRCGGDHSLEDQQSQSSSDKQSSNNVNLTNLTYQQKRQRSIAKRLQLRRKNKN